MSGKAREDDEESSSIILLLVVPINAEAAPNSPRRTGNN